MKWLMMLLLIVIPQLGFASELEDMCAEWKKRVAHEKEKWGMDEYSHLPILSHVLNPRSLVMVKYDCDLKTIVVVSQEFSIGTPEAEVQFKVSKSDAAVSFDKEHSVLTLNIKSHPTGMQIIDGELDFPDASNKAFEIGTMELQYTLKLNTVKTEDYGDKIRFESDTFSGILSETEDGTPLSQLTVRIGEKTLTEVVSESSFMMGFNRTLYPYTLKLNNENVTKPSIVYGKQRFRYGLFFDELVQEFGGD